MKIVINNVESDFKQHALLKVTDLISIISNHFKDIEYVKYTADDPDNFNTNYSFKPFTPQEKLEIVWSHSRRRFIKMNIDKFKNDELYMYDNKCYFGKKVISYEEYNAYIYEEDERKFRKINIASKCNNDMRDLW